MNAARTVVVTGASAGIGRAVVTQQLAAGRHVIGIARDPGAVAGGHYTGVALDLAELAALPERLTALARAHADVSAVVCCAGAGRFGSLEEFAYEDIRELIDLNLTSPAMVARAFLPVMKRNGGGDLVFIGSEAALAGARRGAVYAASKFGLRGLAQSLRQECGSRAVRVCIVNPGMVRTEFFDALAFEPGDDPAHYIEPEDVAAAVGLVLDARRETVIDEINLSPLTRVVRKKPRRAAD